MHDNGDAAGDGEEGEAATTTASPVGSTTKARVRFVSLIWRHYTAPLQQQIDVIRPHAIHSDFSTLPPTLHLICAIRDTLNFFLGLSLNFSKIFPSPVSYFVSYFSVNIDTPSLIFSKYFGVP